MNPDAALDNLRRAVETMATRPFGSQDWQNAADDLAEAAGALDGWLSKGGFLPDPWKHAAVVVPTVFPDGQVEALLAEIEDLRSQLHRYECAADDA